MITLGLTGSIGMGKTTVAAQLAEFGARIISADEIVHKLLGEGGAAVAEVAKHFPHTVENNAVNRKALGDVVFHNEREMKTLEAILHPLVVAEENAFILRERSAGTKIAVLEIPLLYETGAEKRCDAVIVVSAPFPIQEYRVMRRPNMTPEKFRRILGKQMPDREKRKRADFIVQTGFGKAYSRWQVKQILRKLHAA